MNTNEVSLHLSKLLGPPWPWTIMGRHCLARFADLKISYSGGLRDDCSGLHTFLFLKRKADSCYSCFNLNIAKCVRSVVDVARSDLMICLIDPTTQPMPLRCALEHPHRFFRTWGRGSGVAP